MGMQRISRSWLLAHLRMGWITAMRQAAHGLPGAKGDTDKNGDERGAPHDEVGAS